MPGFNQQTVADTYPSSGPGKAIIQNVWTATGGWFSVSAQPVFLQLQYGWSGNEHWTDEQELGAGAFAVIPPEATGIRFRNAVAGSVATVTCWIGQGGPPASNPKLNRLQEPVLSISALGTITTSGKAPTRTVISASGAGTYNTPANCVAILVECWGGGGGGGGTQLTTAAQAAAGGGGGGGAYASVIIPAPAASYTYSVGAGGTGVSGAAGNAGNTTSFGAAPNVSAGGGGAGSLGLAEAPPCVTGPGGAGGTPTVGTVQMGGDYGGHGFVLTTAAVGSGPLVAGAGGAAPLGSSVFGQVSGSGGNNGLAPGGGGSGAAGSPSNAARAGGNGANGLIVVTEFY